MKKQDNDIKIERNCPKCGKVLTYKTVGNLNWANKRNTKCKQCSFRENVGKYIRTEEIKNKISEGHKIGGIGEVGKLKRSKEYKQNPPNKPKYSEDELKERRKKQRKKYNINNQKTTNKYNNTRYNNDPQYKLRRLLSNRINKALKNNFKGGKTIEMLGCSIEKFKLYLEKQFTIEMSWENHGIVWEIDHIKPCSSFDLTNVGEQKECFIFTNMQPLFKTTEIAESFGYVNQIGNRNKSNKYEN